MALLKRQKLRILLLISICFNTSFVVIQFLLHHKDKSLQSRIEIYQTVEGHHNVRSRNLKDKASLIGNEQKLENESYEKGLNQDKNSVKVKIELVEKDVNARFFAAEEFKPEKAVFRKVKKKVPENACPEGGEGLRMYFLLHSIFLILYKSYEN